MKETLSPHLSRDRVCTILLNPRNNAPKNRRHTVNDLLDYAKSKQRHAKICKIHYVVQNYLCIVRCQVTHQINHQKKRKKEKSPL